MRKLCLLIFPPLLWLAACKPAVSEPAPGTRTVLEHGAEVSSASSSGDADHSSFPEAEGARVALVIGNNEYQHAPRLATARPDAQAVAVLLKDLNFRVFLHTDLGRDALADAIDEFRTAAATASAVFVYFAGHGIESPAQGGNFLIPVDARLEKESHLKSQACALDTLLADLRPLPASTRIVVLDCCRNNPLEGRSWARSGGGGLGAVKTEDLDQTTLVVFSAGPGKPAKDRIGERDPHSPFAATLLTEMSRPGRSCLEVFGAVETGVFTLTGQQQRPKTFLNGNLSPFTGFVFRSRPVVAIPPAAEGKATPGTATRERAFVNSLGMEFVPVPITGGPTDGKRILFCRWETRSKDYAVFMADQNRGHPMSGEGADDWRTGGSGGLPVGRGQGERAEESSHPVVNVSWEDAQAFCAWLGRRERTTCRLPSDHEWSCAVGIGRRENAAASPKSRSEGIGNVYPWGGSFVSSEMQGNYAGEETGGKAGINIIAGYRDGFERTAPVGSFAANAAGLHDLGGNVWEWCGDRHEPGKEERVVRGGSWDDYDPVYLSSPYRDAGLPGTRRAYFGFRVVLEVSGG